jgi:acetyl-CoA C-acetyltransferase
LDELALVSQQRANQAIREGRFDRALVPVYRDDGSIALDREEFPRPETTLEGLAGLKASFGAIAGVPIDEAGTTLGGLIHQVYPDLRIEHVHHAGNSSGVVDGAAAVLLASPAYAAKHGLKPRARIVAMANMGDSPTLMLNAPVPAARKVLAKAGLTVDDIDLWEINEAFAVVAEKFIRDLGRFFAAFGFEAFSATAARISALNAASSIASPWRKSMARRVAPSRLELNRPDGSSSDAPLAKVVFTAAL